MHLVRPVYEADIDALFSLAQRVAPGMTTFPPDRQILLEKITASNQAFAGSADSKDFLMVLEDCKTGQILGTAGIYGDIGKHQPFYSFTILNNTRHCNSLDMQVATQTLNLVNAFDGDVEVGTLILDPDKRGSGFGTLLSKARYLLIAEFRKRFGPRVLAELRGWSDENAISPFWENVGKVFFNQLSYVEADLLSATTDNQFIADLMPDYPVCVGLLPKAAQEVIGKPHDSGKNALAMLLKEGFRYENLVDIFDAGPTVYANVEDIHTVAKSSRYKVASSGGPSLGSFECLLCNCHLSHFRVTKNRVNLNQNREVVLGSELLECLRIETGSYVRVYPLEEIQ